MSLNILVVDDNPTNLKLACDLLEIEGHKVSKAVDGEAALAAVGNTRFDLILMDIELPGMDGLAVTRLIKANPVTRHVPVVALTAFAMKGDDEKALQAGCAGYITKPIDTRLFPTQVQQFAGRSAKA